MRKKYATAKKVRRLSPISFIYALGIPALVFGMLRADVPALLLGFLYLFIGSFRRVQ
jgi:hypothetical protein